MASPAREARARGGGRGEDTGKWKLACGHRVDELDLVTLYPSGRKLFRCSICQRLVKKESGR